MSDDFTGVNPDTDALMEAVKQATEKSFAEGTEVPFQLIAYREGRVQLHSMMMTDDIEAIQHAMLVMAAGSECELLVQISDTFMANDGNPEEWGRGEMAMEWITDGPRKHMLSEALVVTTCDRQGVVRLINQGYERFGPEIIWTAKTVIAAENGELGGAVVDGLRHAMSVPLMTDMLAGMGVEPEQFALSVESARMSALLATTKWLLNNHHPTMIAAPLEFADLVKESLADYESERLDDN